MARTKSTALRVHPRMQIPGAAKPCGPLEINGSAFRVVRLLVEGKSGWGSNIYGHNDQRPFKKQKPNSDTRNVPIARRTFSVQWRGAHYRELATKTQTDQTMRFLAKNPVSYTFERAHRTFQMSFSESDGIVFKKSKLDKAYLEPEVLGDLTAKDKIILDMLANPVHSSPISTSAVIRVDHSLEDACITLTVDLELRWHVDSYVQGDLHGKAHILQRNRILEEFYPDIPLVSLPKTGNVRIKDAKWSPQDFYEAAHVPEKTADADEDVSVPGLTATLFPFQRRAVRWLLMREAVSLSKDGSVVPYEEPSDPEITSHFMEVRDADGEPFYVSSLFGLVTRKKEIFENYEKMFRGGILSEEMGLGKTVEMISLMLLHPQPPHEQSSEAVAAAQSILMENDDEKVVDLTPAPPPPRLLRPTGATLIVAPPALKEQWISEIKLHAPHLRVLVYIGIAGAGADADREAAMVEELSQQDVVITTYADLRPEFHFALDPPQRPRRAERKYHRPSSPLVQLRWWRICLDEAQEIENGVSSVATLLRILPRVNAWGVTGTPVKDGVQDLWGLLLFLRYEPYASIPEVWRNLTQNYKAAFQHLFGRIALRHTKRSVGDELAIPPQKRYVITMPFTAVEEQHYQGLFRHLSESCGLNTFGAPLRGDWDPDDSEVLEAMRAALNRLRQTALHPEIGEQNRRALGHRGGGGPMRTVAEVLDAMIEQSENALLVDRRALLNSKLTRGQLLENSPRVKLALEIWKEVGEECKVLVQEARDKLKLEVEKAKEATKNGDEASKAGKNDDDSTDEDSDDDDDDDMDEDKLSAGRVNEAQRELRYALEILHKAEFFCANGYFQIKTNVDLTQPDSDEFKELERQEVEGYEKAKHVRQEILQESRSKAIRLMEKLRGKVSTQDFVTLPDCSFVYPKGIEGRAAGEELDKLSIVLNTQANQIDDWREEAIQLLLKDLVDEDEGAEITGDEYENSTKVQDDIQAYVTILKAAISDRLQLLTGQVPSELAMYELKTAMRMAADGDGPAPHLMVRLFTERADTVPVEDDEVKSLRKSMVDLRELAAKLRERADRGNRRAQLELDCVSEQLKTAQQQQTQQLKANTSLEEEITRIRQALNSRIAYYRQLQIVSDMVAPYEGEQGDAAMGAALELETRLRQSVASTEAKHRYLIHLKEADASDESRICVICQCTFSIGVLTVCGHRFCKECMTLWYRAHRNCPVCKRKLNANNLHDIVLKPQELKVVSENSQGEAQQENDGQDNGTGSSPQQKTDGRSKRTGIYSTFNAQKLAAIKNIDLPGPSFTTKVDTLVRHLLWLRTSDPGAKTIVFSQFPDFLSILAQAFSMHHIGFSRYADTRGIQRFKEDASVEVFLLHARAHSSGLNLVNASHVILCEPLLNTALELQAIARVHRIGQKHETTVWLYIVDGTVEESIYNLSVQRRLEHMDRTVQKQKGKSKESTPEVLDSNLELANSLELQQAQLSKLMSKGKMAGEEVDKGDLWTCLFGNRTQEAAPQEGAAATAADNEERLRNNPAVRRYLAANAAEERQEMGDQE